MSSQAKDPTHLRWPDATERAWLSEQLRAERLQRRLRAAAARSAFASVRGEQARFAPSGGRAARTAYPAQMAPALGETGPAAPAP